MKELIKELYNINVNVLIKVSNLVYRIRSDDGDFALKYYENKELEAVYTRLNMLNINSFAIPLKNKFGNYISENENYYFEIGKWYQDEELLAKDIRIKMFLSNLALLHNKSFYSIKVNNSFYSDSYDFIEKLIEESQKDLTSELEKIEKLSYKSPSQWLFIMNNNRFQMTINKAKTYLKKFKEETKDRPQLRVSLTYNNFEYNHIKVKEDKILSCRLITIGPPLYDLKHLFDKSFSSSIDITDFFIEYLKKFQLQKYERYWLASLLLIPVIEIEGSSEIERIVDISKLISQMRNAEEIEKLLNDENEEKY